MDYTIGRKITGICQELKIFSKIKPYIKNYDTTPDIKTLLSQRLDELKDKFISANLITEKDYSQFKQDVNYFLKEDKNCDKCRIMSEQSHILAYKEKI